MSAQAIYHRAKNARFYDKDILWSFKLISEVNSKLHFLFKKKAVKSISPAEGFSQFLTEP